MSTELRVASSVAALPSNRQLLYFFPPFFGLEVPRPPFLPADFFPVGRLPPLPLPACLVGCVTPSTMPSRAPTAPPASFAAASSAPVFFALGVRAGRSGAVKRCPSKLISLMRTAVNAWRCPRSFLYCFLRL